MCFNNKYKWRTLHRGCYKIITEKTKQAENEIQTFFEIVLNSFSIIYMKVLYMTK